MSHTKIELEVRLLEAEVLLSEALEMLTNEQTEVDYRDWVRAARAWLTGRQTFGREDAKVFEKVFQAMLANAERAKPGSA